MEHRKKFFLADNRDAQRLRFCQLGARRLAREHIARFLRDGRRRLAAVLCDERFRLRAGKRGQRAGNHQRFARQTVCLFRPVVAHIDASLPQTAHQILRTIFGKKVQHALGHHPSEAVDRVDFFLRRGLHRLHRNEMLRQQCGALTADIADAQSKQKLVQPIPPRSGDSRQKI